MRALVVVVVILLVLFLIGWLTFGNADGDPSISIDTDKVKQDTEMVVDKAKEAADEIDRRVDVDVDTSPEPAPEP